jgi:hypothetical protein
LNEIKQIIEESSMGAIAKKADLIVEGRIVDIQVSKLKPPEEYVRSGRIGGVAEVRTITLRAEAVYKGPVEVGDPVTFRMIGRGGYSPPWRREVPRCIEVSERWLAALQDDPEIGYFPFAGSNGLLRIEPNGELSYEGLSRFPAKYGLSKTQLERVIQDALR